MQNWKVWDTVRAYQEDDRVLKGCGVAVSRDRPGICAVGVSVWMKLYGQWFLTLGLPIDFMPNENGMSVRLIWGLETLQKSHEHSHLWNL